MSNDIASLQLRGSARKGASDRFSTQMKEWGLRAPDVEPFIWDFGLGEFDSVGLIEYWIANELEAGYCAKYLFVFNGQRCPLHAHGQKHETFMVLKGKVGMMEDNIEKTMEEGEIRVMPPGRRHSFVGIGNALVLEVSTPCLVSDNQFEDDEIMRWMKRTMGGGAK